MTNEQPNRTIKYEVGAELAERQLGSVVEGPPVNNQDLEQQTLNISQQHNSLLLLAM